LSSFHAEVPMNRAWIACLACVAAAVAVGGVASCSTANSGAPRGGDAGVADGGALDGGQLDAGPFAPALPCTDSISSVYADPGDVSSAAKGAILKCAHDQDFTASELLALATAPDDAGIPVYTSPPYVGKAFTSGAHAFRVLYRTERGDPNASPGYSSALVLLPDTPRAGVMPVVVASHGTRGQAGQCAPSLSSPAALFGYYDFIHLVYPLVGFGYAVIAPDYAGYANYGGANNPPSGYLDSDDEGKSVLDGVTALRNVLPAPSLSQQIVLVGWSQGGHASLSALSLVGAGSYPISGTVAAVAMYEPGWASMRICAGIFNEPSVFDFAQSAVGEFCLWYYYTHATLLDGLDAGTDGIFNPATFGALQSFMNDECVAASYPALYDAGASTNDFLTSSFIQATELAALPLGSCNGNATCETWMGRMTADWPHLTGAATKPPMLLWYTNGDWVIPPSNMQCTLNRLASDGTNLQVCYDPDPVGHPGALSENAAYVADWIAQQTLGGPAPTEPCQAIVASEGGAPQLTEDGGPVPCNPDIPTQ
jgi:dienelactone hydrolase